MGSLEGPGQPVFFKRKVQGASPQNGTWKPSDSEIHPGTWAQTYGSDLRHHRWGNPQRWATGTIRSSGLGSSLIPAEAAKDPLPSLSSTFSPANHEYFPKNKENCFSCPGSCSKYWGFSLSWGRSKSKVRTAAIISMNQGMGQWWTLSSPFSRCLPLHAFRERWQMERDVERRRANTRVTWQTNPPEIRVLFLILTDLVGR